MITISYWLDFEFWMCCNLKQLDDIGIINEDGPSGPSMNAFSASIIEKVVGRHFYLFF